MSKLRRGALVAISNCGDGEQKTIRKLASKTDGTANAVAVGTGDAVVRRGKN